MTNTQANGSGCSRFFVKRSDASKAFAVLGSARARARALRSAVTGARARALRGTLACAGARACVLRGTLASTHAFPSARTARVQKPRNAQLICRLILLARALLRGNVASGGPHTRGRGAIVQACCAARHVIAVHQRERARVHLAQKRSETRVTSICQRAGNTACVQAVVHAHPFGAGIVKRVAHNATHTILFGAGGAGNRNGSRVHAIFQLAHARRTAYAAHANLTRNVHMIRQVFQRTAVRVCHNAARHPAARSHVHGAAYTQIAHCAARNAAKKRLIIGSIRRLGSAANLQARYSVTAAIKVAAKRA